MNEMEPIEEFEKQVAQALRRVDAPAGFAQRVMAREAAEAHISKSRYGAPAAVAKLRGRLIALRPQFLPRFPIWLSGAVAATVVFAVFVGQQLHMHQERTMADKQFALSMQIQERAMEHTRRQLQRAGVPLD